MDVFFDDEDRYLFLEQLAHYTTKAGVSIISYCLMMNHTHLLLVPSDEEVERNPRARSAKLRVAIIGKEDE